MIWSRARRALALSLSLVLLAGGAAADEVLSQSNDPHVMLDDHLATLLGPDSRALRPLPLAAQAKIPRPPVVRYDGAFIADLPPASGNEEWRCLAEALYFEARGESVKGMFAVAEVILNRVDSPRFPDTVCEVVSQGTGERFRCQFTYTCDGRAETIAEPRAFRRVGKIARLMLDGAPRRLTDGSTHYHTTSVHPGWAQRLAHVATIGDHEFYRRKS